MWHGGMDVVLGAFMSRLVHFYFFSLRILNIFSVLMPTVGGEMIPSGGKFTQYFNASFNYHVFFNDHWDIIGLNHVTVGIGSEHGW